MADTIKRLRTSRKLTQTELARLSGVPFSTINRIERGVANPTLLTLDRVLAVFGLKLSTEGGRD